MTFMPLPPWKPDLGVYNTDSTTVATNILRTANGITPIKDLQNISDNLNYPCRGAWTYRNNLGEYGLIAATTVGIWKLGADGFWDDISGTTYEGPDDGELWQADIFGNLIIMVNANDPPQKFNIDTGTVCSDLGGSPPRAKYIETVGDFVFLSYHRSTDGNTDYPTRWQHSLINDAENWTIDGLEGSSDRQDIPDGEDIQGIASCPGGARIFQRRCKRRLTFSPGSPVAFTMTDLDASRGCIAPNAIVPIGGDQYIYLGESGFYMGDGHEPIGAEQVDRYFFEQVGAEYLEYTQGVNDPTLRIVWFRWKNGAGTPRLIGYNWQLGQWLDCDVQVTVLVNAVSVTTTMDDMGTATMDSATYGDLPMDTRAFDGGRQTMAAFYQNVGGESLYLFAGAAMAVTLDTATTALNPGTGSFVTGTKLIGDVPTYTVKISATTLVDDPINFNAGSTRSFRTGKCPARSDGKFHRFELVIPAGTSWSLAHGLDVEANPSGGA